MSEDVVMILRLARKTPETAFFSLILQDFLYSCIRCLGFGMVEAGGQHIQTMFHKKTCLICFFSSNVFPLNRNLNFPYFQCFLQKQGDDWSTLGAKLEGLMFNHQWYWHESPEARLHRLSQCKSLKICSLFQRFFAQSA